MLAEPIARPLDLDDDGVMEESVEQRRGDDRVAEDVAPFGEAAVGGEDHRTLFVAGIDQLEEQVATAGDDRQVADLVEMSSAERASQRRRSRRHPSRSALASEAMMSARVEK